MSTVWILLLAVAVLLVVLVPGHAAVLLVFVGVVGLVTGWFWLLFTERTPRKPLPLDMGRNRG